MTASVPAQTFRPPPGVDFNDETLFERGQHLAAFARLRREAPVSWTPPTAEQRGYWNLVRHAEVLQVSQQPGLFSSESGISLYEPHEQADGFSEGGRNLIMVDPPRHTQQRRLINKAFTPRAIARWEDDIRLLTGQLLDGLAERGETEFVQDVAARIPLALICRMLGVPESDWPLMYELGNRLFAPVDPDSQCAAADAERGTRGAARETRSRASFEMFSYFAALLRQRRDAGADDLLTQLCHSEIDGRRLSRTEVLWFCYLLVPAGNETTRNAMSGGLLALLRHPDQLQLLRDRPALLPRAIEEMLRWVSPVLHMARVATQDTVLGGQAIAAGERVVMWYPSANRDEARFAEPDRFDIMRDAREHLALGIGQHFCLGGALARMQLRLLFEALLSRFPHIELAGPVERLRSSFVAGIKRMPLRLH